MRRLEEAIAKGLNHVFETTLGGKSVTEKILQAAKTLDVLIWFCGLSSPELHIARVKARVAGGDRRRHRAGPSPRARYGKRPNHHPGPR